MKLVLNIFGIIAAALAIILSFTPTDTIPLLPAIVGLLLGFIALKINQKQLQKTKTSKIIIAISFLAASIVLCKAVFLENEVAVDEVFEEKQEQSEEDLNELNEIEELNGLEE
jgi:thiol:disulfide interchange protein